MHKIKIPDTVKSVLNKIEQSSIFSGFQILSEEEQTLHYTFDQQGELKPLEDRSNSVFRTIDFDCPPIKFKAFLDGIQRTVMLPHKILLPSGALVPIHVAHIAAAVILRNDSGRLFIDPELVKSRFLLLGPFNGIEKESGKEIVPSEHDRYVDELTFKVPEGPDEWIICDTTYKGIGSHSLNEEELLIGRNLLNEGLIRSRAQGKVANIRQRLEVIVLTLFREKYPDHWILVHGPLFFLAKWRRKATKYLGKFLNENNPTKFEEKLLDKTVGFIRTHRLRPPLSDLQCILKLDSNRRSIVYRLTKEVDQKNTGPYIDELDTYAAAHLTWYTRISRGHRKLLGLNGLIRIDVHRSTFNIINFDDFNHKDFIAHENKVNSITLGVLKEKWPSVKQRTLSYTSTLLYPHYQLKKIMEASLLPRRLLAHLIHR